MIHKIVIENFFSIAERQEISFSVLDNAPDLPCFNNSPALPSIRLPNSIGFFGPNASGKTTVLKAIIAVTTFARDSFFSNPQENLPVFWIKPFNHKDWMNKPSIIVIEFDARLSSNHPIELLRYELQIFHSKNDNKKIIAYEALSHSPNGKARKLFERKEQSFKFSKEFNINESDPRVQSIRPDASLISTLAQFNHPILTHLRNSLSYVQTNLMRLGKKERPPFSALFKLYLDNPSLLEALNREIKRFDLGLEEMKIIQTSEGLIAVFKHVGLDDPMFIFDQSAGTESFIDLFPKLQFVLEYGGVAILDELDADIHPALLPEILNWFSDKERNKHGAQLIFTAHNPALLNELEKEQVFFTEKVYGKPTQIYGARDIKGLRREPSLMKKYLTGELGAIPYIG